MFIISKLFNRISRVITRAIATTGSKETFMKSIDNDVMGVIIGKQSILQARKLSLNVAITKNNEFNIFDTIAISTSDSTTISNSISISPDSNSSIRPVLDLLYP